MTSPFMVRYLTMSGKSTFSIPRSVVRGRLSYDLEFPGREVGKDFDRRMRIDEFLCLIYIPKYEPKTP
jgi:hypothetical protein